MDAAIYSPGTSFLGVVLCLVIPDSTLSLSIRFGLVHFIVVAAFYYLFI